jgi:hypothetical protein
VEGKQLAGPLRAGGIQPAQHALPRAPVQPPDRGGPAQGGPHPEAKLVVQVLQIHREAIVQNAGQRS